MKPQAGFTLFELLAVLVLAAVLATVVGVSLAQQRNQVEMDDVLAQVVFLDAQVRARARQFDRPAQLRIDLRRGLLEPVEQAERDRFGQAAPPTLQLPAGYTIEAVRVSGQLIQHRETAIACSAHGRTVSYAVQIRSPAGERRWLLWTGLTGQVQALADDEARVQAILEELLGDQP